MSNNNRGRRILWWNMPVSPDDSAEVGGEMMRTILIWVGILALLILIIIVGQAIL